MEKLISDKISVICLIILSIILYLISDYIYKFDLNIINQDASGYRLLATDLSNYFSINQQDALRIFPALIVNFISNLINVDVDIAFRICANIFFLLLLIKTFYFFKKFNISSHLSLSSTIILYFFNHSVIYLIFNYYQLIDLLLYILSLYIIESSIFNKRISLFITSILAIFTKEFLFVLVIMAYLFRYFKFKEKDYLKFLILVFLFSANYCFAGINFDQISNEKVSGLILSYFLGFENFINSIHISLIHDKNILLFFPFILIIFNKEFLKSQFKYLLFYFYALIPISFSVLIYQNVGNNFFRVFYQGYFIFVIFSLIYLNSKINDNNILKNLLFLLPITFLIDLFYILVNLKQTGLFDYFQHNRYFYLSGYYLFNLIFLYILFKASKIK